MEVKISDLYNLDNTIAAPLLARFVYPWEALGSIADFIREVGPTLPKEEFDNPKDGVWIARDACVFESAYLAGPLIVDHGAEIRHCAFVRGSAIVGKNAVVGNSVEVKNSVLFDNVQAPHYNYVGDSILGYRSHLGAGAVTSNLKSDRSLVCVRDLTGAAASAAERAGDVGEVEEIPTGLKKFGAMLGDNVEVGCNSVLCPGTVIGAGSRVYPLSRVRGYVPAGVIFKDAEHLVAIR